MALTDLVVEVAGADPGPVEGVVGAAEPAFELCALAARPPLAGVTEVVLALRLGPAGEVTQAAVTSRPHAGELADCLRKQARSLRFIEGPARVRVRLVLEAPAPQGETAKQYRAP
ncbi:MAG: hypothetical protein R3F60_10265 [bacterium]